MDSRSGLLPLHGWSVQLCIAKRHDKPHLLLIREKTKASKEMATTTYRNGFHRPRIRSFSAPLAPLPLLSKATAARRRATCARSASIRPISRTHAAANRDFQRPLRRGALSSQGSNGSTSRDGGPLFFCRSIAAHFQAEVPGGFSSGNICKMRRAFL